MGGAIAISSVGCQVSLLGHYARLCRATGCFHFDFAFPIWTHLEITS